MGVASVAYCLHKLKFAVKSMKTQRNILIGAMGFMGIFSLLNMVPSDGNVVPQIGLVVFGGEDTKIPLGSMYPWKYIGLIGMMLTGLVVLALYLKAAAGGFHWGRASRWSQYALITTAVTVVLTMMTMGYTRETARRAEPIDGSSGWLIHGCVTFDQEIVREGCPITEPELAP
jgi:cytochrome d ubiquinol oxidase subunit I